jgi:hypothetical protein
MADEKFANGLRVEQNPDGWFIVRDLFWSGSYSYKKVAGPFSNESIAKAEMDKLRG